MSLDDLDDTPLPTSTPASSPAVADYLDYLDGLIDTPETYGDALDTLTGIRATIHARQRITEGQRTAVRHIVAGAREDDTPRIRSRRYEGWSRQG